MKNSIYKANMSLIVSVITAMVVSQLLQLIAPMMMRLILEFLQTPGDPTAEVYTYAILITLAFFLRAMISQHGLHYSNVLTFRIQGQINLEVIP